MNVKAIILFLLLAVVTAGSSAPFKFFSDVMKKTSILRRPVMHPKIPYGYSRFMRASRSRMIKDYQINHPRAVFNTRIR